MKKNLFKRATALVLAIIVLMAVAACGSKSNNQNGNNEFAKIEKPSTKDEVVDLGGYEFVIAADWQYYDDVTGKDLIVSEQVFQQRREEVEKEYIAVCIGSLPQKQGVINEEIVQHGQKKTAVTHFKVLEEQELEWEGQKIILSKVSLVLQTGRMHQIRIHLAKQGCPIAGDDQHGNFKLNKVLRKAAGIKQLQLFSVRLTVPGDGKNLVFTLDY